MAKRRGTSLADIAKATGVTTATVSRVLNNRYEGFSVRPELKQRILKAAQDLSYRPDLMAQSLRKNDTFIVGLLGTFAKLNIPEQMLRSLIETLQANQVRLTTDFASTMEKSHDLPPWRIDAAVMNSALSEADTAAVERAGIPYVSINGWCGKGGISLQFDDADGARQALQHLISLGHKRIAYANSGGPWGTHPSVAVRHQAYLACLREHGLRPVPGHDRPVDDPVHDFVKRTVLEGGATAILAYHHYFAVYILQACSHLGIDVPGRVSVACFNDEYPLMFLHPTVTAVALPVGDAGRTAAELLIKQLRGEVKERPIVMLKEQLTIRESTAPPPKSL